MKINSSNFNPAYVNQNTAKKQSRAASFGNSQSRQQQSGPSAGTSAFVGLAGALTGGTLGKVGTDYFSRVGTKQAVELAFIEPPKGFTKKQFIRNTAETVMKSPIKHVAIAAGALAGAMATLGALNPHNKN